MDNLSSAKSAVEAELEHAQRGVAHYQNRIIALEKILVEISKLPGSNTDLNSDSTQPAKRKYVKRSKDAVEQAAVADSKKGTKAKPAKAKGSHSLPSTGGTFWEDLITTEPKSFSDVLAAAFAALGVQETKENKQKLAGRATFALNAMVNAKKIRDSGRGRERRFFKS